MAISAEYADFVSEQLTVLGAIAIRRMFGGAGVYCQGVMFGLIVDESLYLKADDENRADYDAAGSKPFSFQSSRGKRVLTSYYEVPADLLDDVEKLAGWSRKALDAALRARQPGSARRRPPSRVRGRA